MSETIEKSTGVKAHGTATSPHGIATTTGSASPTIWCAAEPTHAPANTSGKIWPPKTNQPEYSVRCARGGWARTDEAEAERQCEAQHLDDR